MPPVSCQRPVGSSQLAAQNMTLLAGCCFYGLYLDTWTTEDAQGCCCFSKRWMAALAGCITKQLPLIRLIATQAAFLLLKAER
jgi:hypothetical protein